MSRRLTIQTLLPIVMVCTVLAGCAPGVALPPLRHVAHVDLERFMGDWYVIASIPTFLERDAHDAVETYRRDPDGTIATAFTFRAGDLNGPQKRYTMRGHVIDTTSNAVWAMQVMALLRLDYRIVHLSSDYSVTAIGRERRDYAWIMARRPFIDDASFNAVSATLANAGYDLSKLRRVPHREGGKP